jgi:murein DD-endopeptidase MepM/ murein hydrolase activator NlpD
MPEKSPFFIIEKGMKTLSGFSKSKLFFPISRPILREDNVVYDQNYPKSEGHLASWKSATFGMVRNGGTRAHQGWDFFAMPHTPVFAVGDAHVSLVYKQKDYGLVLVARLMQPLVRFQKIYFVYAHLNKICVSEGQFIKGGQMIGETGLTGNAAQFPRYPHLHFELRTEARPYKEGDSLFGRVDPAHLFGDAQNFRLSAFRQDSIPGSVARAIPTS